MHPLHNVLDIIEVVIRQHFIGQSLYSPSRRKSRIMTCDHVQNGQQKNDKFPYRLAYKIPLNKLYIYNTSLQYM